jgi:monovalent cation:H+ antiporter-2, CPA2 family
MSEETRIVIDMALLLLISGVCSLVFAKIKMPPILGYLAAGIILGPTMFPDLWVEGTTVDLLSNIGIVFLMFFIGLETDIAKLRTNGMKLIFVVGLQMPIVVVCGYLAGIMLGMNFIQSIFLGAIISGTSTAVVVGVLKTNDHISDDLAKTIITITIFEDVGQVIILSLAAPLLAGDSPALGSTLLMVVAMILFIGFTLLFGIALIPRLLNYIGDKFSGEILLIISCGLCFAMAAISNTIGLSIAIGAFLMGMIISLSLYSHTIASKVESVKDLFMAVFFISIGLQISPSLIYNNIGLAVIIAVVFTISKMGSVTLSCYIANMKARDSLVIGMSLVAMGEFAFIIAKQALDAGVVTMDFYSAVIGAALITMIVMPVLTKAQPRILDWLWRNVPIGLRESITRIDRVRTKPYKKKPAYTEAERTVKKGLFFIAIDCIVMFIIMVIFDVIEGIESHFASAADYLNILPKELLVVAVIIVLVPAIYNIRYHVRILSGALTLMALESSQCNPKNAGYLFRIYFNLGNIAMLLLVMVIVIPFIPESTIVSPAGVVIVVLGALLICYLAWDMIRRGYKKFFMMITKNDMFEESEKKKI